MDHEVHDLAAMRPQTMCDSTLQAEAGTHANVCPLLKFSWGRAQVADTMIEATLSVIVMLVTDTGDKVAYRLGRSQGRSRTQTSRGGLIGGRRHDQGRYQNYCLVAGMFPELGD